MFGKSKAKSFFAFLEQDFGFRLEKFEYSARHFGNFVAEYQRSDAVISITRDRAQVFVELVGRDGEWYDKDDLLEEFGVNRDRYPIENGLWTGYELEKQVTELRAYLPQLLARIGAAPSPSASQSPPPNSH